MNETDLPGKLKLPSHVMAFRCSMCGKCCTNKWKINVDCPSYNKLHKKFQELGRQEELSNNILHDKESSQIRFLENGKCPFLSDDNLCAIHLELGGEYQLDICKVYPRNIFASNRTLEFSLFLTCKAAIDTLRQGSIRIVETEWPIANQEEIPFSFMLPNTIKQYSPDKPMGGPQFPYYALEAAFIELIQDNSHPISQRLVILGNVLGRLISGDTPQVGNTAAPNLESIVSESRPITQLPDWDLHLEQFYQLSNIFIRKFPSVPESKLLNNILLVLSSEEPQQAESAVKGICPKVQPPQPAYFQRMMNKYHRPARAIIEPIIENYMVNYILSKQFYLKPLHLAYYRMTFSFAAITALSLGYSILANRPTSQKITLQAIYDVENIFFNNWFFPYAAFLQGGKGYLRIIENAIALANI